MNHSLKTRLLAMLLALVMLVGMVPTSALAEEIVEEAAEIEAEAVAETTAATEELAASEEAAMAAAENTEATTETEAETTTESGSEPVEVTYTVAHYLQNLAEEGYTLDKTETLSTAEAVTAAEAADYVGFAPLTFAQAEVAADGSTVVEIYYDRLNCTVSFDVNGGEGTYEDQNVPFGGAVTAPEEEPMQEGFAFEGWFLGEEPWNFETGTVTADMALTASWTQVEDTEEIPVAEASEGYDPSVSGGYFGVISEKRYDLAPGAEEVEIVLNNAEGNDRKVVHVFEVDTTVDTLEVMPGYYRIDKLDPDNLKDKTYWKAEQLTKTVAYYENDLGYNVVGAMNTALAYDSDAPYGYMVWQGVELGNPTVHPGAQTYLAIDKDGTCELRSMTTPLDGDEWTAIPANFTWLVKDGTLISTSVERTSSDASRSMIGIKADGTLVFCQVDGRNAPFSSGLSNYEMGEMMLALGCVNAVNCDGGGSSTFISKREGESENVMRSIPSDGSERATINSVVLVSNAKADGEFDHAIISSDYDYFAPGASGSVSAVGIDAAGGPAVIPADVTWQLENPNYGTIENGVFTASPEANGVNATIQMVYEGRIVGEKTVSIIHPDSFGFGVDSTVIPYGKTITLEIEALYGADDWNVCVDGVYTLSLSNPAAATLSGKMLTATTDESESETKVVITYNADPTVTDTMTVTLGKGSEVIFDFEDGEVSDWMGFVDAKQWSIDNGVNNTLVGSAPLAGQFNEQLSSDTFLATRNNGGQVRNGNYALAWAIDNTDADFAGWSYNVLFNTGETVVLRDVANGKMATTLGMWLYIPEGAAGLAFQYQLYAKNADGTYSCKQDHFTFETVSGVRKNLNSCTEADIPESRWVYASVDLSAYDYLCTSVPTDESNSRSPSIIRTYVKPTAPAVHTFYIDDITLDYSSAVEDRILPVISNVSYTTADESVALAEGAQINGNSISFTAKISDNAGLNYGTGRILVDGNPVGEVTCSGSNLSSGSVLLTSGVHTVTFEVKDQLGNTAKAVRTFTILGDAPITVTGHNESGALAEYDSVYYVDINAADMSTVKKLTATIELQNANTWEPEGMVAAPGFKAEYSLNEITNRVTVTVTREAAAAAESGTVVSIPVRLWSWNGVNNVTEEEIKPETQFAGGYCPIVTIDYKVISGTVEYTFGSYDGYLGAFGGKASVKTNINDIEAPWHYHTAAPVEDVAPDCDSAGYTGRTYCHVCKSVVDWGTILDALGHQYALKDNVLQCVCGDKFTGVWEDGRAYENGTVMADGWLEESYYRDGYKLTGVQLISEAEGDFYYDFGTDGICAGRAKFTGVFLDQEAKVYRYAQLGTIATGWQMIDDEWYHFDPVTKAASVGDVEMTPVVYNFQENGKLTAGVWAKTLRGTRYYYGPSCYQRGWLTVDGKDYFFEDYVRVEGGIQNVFENNINAKWYRFDENGICNREEVIPDGFYTDRNGYGYNQGGVALTGLQLIDGTYYFFDRYGYAITGDFAGYYFGEDYKAFTGITDRDGTLRYYRNGRPRMDGLIQIDGDYYFASGDGKIITGEYYVWQGNGIIPESNRVFGEDGKLLQGVVERNGGYYYYNMGKPEMAGLIEVDGAYYFVRNAQGEVITNQTYYVWQGNGIIPESNREFGPDGKLLHGVVQKDEGYYYYNMGKPEMAGLIYVDGSYYFARGGNGEIITDQYYYVWKSNGLLPEGNYQFGPDGKMRDGIVQIDGAYYYYVNGRAKMAGLIEVDGEYYFAGGEGKLITDQTYYVWQGNGIIPESNRTFDAQGRLLRGIVERDGGYYYYNMGRTEMAGLVEVDGEYYFAKDAKGTLITNQTYYVWDGNGIIPESERTFGPDGKMLNGIVEIDGARYYYNMGRGEMAGLIEIDGKYYFAKNAKGALIQNQSYYVWKGNGLLPESTYLFGEDGSMLDGFVERADGIYYYENGKLGEVGLNYIDGYYYFIGSDGKLVTSQTYYVWKPNGYCVPGNYTFDANGRIIL